MANNKDLILRALTDPGFRKLLTDNPEKALAARITPKNQKEIRSVLDLVNKLESQIGRLADELLCANGGHLPVGSRR
jgi:hypothetical protein